MNAIKKHYAIVAMGCIFPDADNTEKLWNNIISGKVSIKEIDSRHLDKEVFYRPDVYGKVNKNDKSYTKVGASIQNFQFQGKDFWIPPAIAKHMDDNQKVALLSAKQVFDSYSIDRYDRHRIAVIMGCSGYGELHHDFHRRFTFNRFSHKLQKNSHILDKFSAEDQVKLINELAEQCIGDTFGTSEDSAPGMLPNIIASRISNFYNIHGPTHTVDAACASGLAAIAVAIQYLDNNLVDVVLCGAADMAIKEAGYIYFSGINALSPDGSYPFDERANGFVIGQGAGAILVKRLADAIKDNDKIYAVITGYGSVNDGKGKAIAAPNSKWQAQTINRACEMAGYPVDTIELIEAHGTATKVGDLSEVNALKESFTNRGVRGKNFCGLTSVKSNIGHLKSAAGIAGIIKTVLALENKVLPPIGGFQKENPKLELKDSPFYTLATSREWAKSDHPRRAGVNAFGFGGVNYHIALQEYRQQDFDTSKLHFAQFKKLDHTENQTTDSVHKPEESQLFLVSSPSKENLDNQLNQIFSEAQNKGLSKAAESAFLKAEASLKIRCGFLCQSVEELSEKISLIKDYFNGQPNQLRLKSNKIFIHQGPAFKQSEIAVMFPGQGSQYPDMMESLVSKYALAKEVLNHGDTLYQKLKGQKISDLTCSKSRGKDETVQLLKKTENTHPVIFTYDYMMFQLLKSVGISPGFFIGHSAGEIPALTAAGSLGYSQGLGLMIKRASAFLENASKTPGAMAAANTEKDVLKQLFVAENLDLHLANINSPSQIIVSGKASEIDRFVIVCREKGIKATPIPVTQAFHSPLVSAVQKAFKKVIEKSEFRDIQDKVICNETNEYYSLQGASIKKSLSTQITGSVQFMESIKKLYDDGARVFIELGPGSVLSSLTKDILANKDCVILASDHKKNDSAECFESLLAALFSVGIDIETLPMKNYSSIRFYSNEKMIQSKKSVSVSKEERRVVYSGVSIGLPGSYKDCFQDDNFEQLFNGQNCIERLDDKERKKLVDLNITKLVKSEQGASYQQLTSLNDVIQLAGKLGKLDLSQYQIDPKEALIMSSSIAAAVAAGYEALRDAKIPMVHEYAKTASGAMLPARWSLPQHMQADTGVIFANGFPLVDPVIKEVSRHLTAKLRKLSKNDFLSFYETLVQNVTDENARKTLSDWYIKHHLTGSAPSSEDDIYKFNYTLMSQIASQANNRLAQYINARGPNFLIDAACSSTTTAITLAEEMIKSGRVKRMVIIGADDTANESIFPYIGAGFLSTGACSNEADLYKAAIPFDRRRNGMIMGSGAIGILLEDLKETEKRGIAPVAELLGTHIFNAAGHQSQLDVSMYADQMEQFIARMEKEKNLDRSKMAQSMVYLSHETYTPARGGCSQSEATSLKHVFGADFSKIEISNTKGMTGHTMGASLEDAVAAKALQLGKVPPIVNHAEIDPELEGLKLSKGGNHNCQYALRLAAGFGAQGNFILLRKMAHQEQRIIDKNKYSQWLQRISKLENPELEYRGRILSIKDSQPGALELQRPDIYNAHSMDSEKPKPPNSNQAEAEIVKPSNKSNIAQKVMAVISEISGYSSDLLDPSMELEADLGIDTVKQATILSQLEEKLGKTDNTQSISLSDYQTIEKIIKLFANKNTIQPPSLSAQNMKKSTKKMNTIDNKKKAIIFSVISQITGYDESILDLEMELEADLGIDTVKQATILSQLEEQFGIDNNRQNIKLSDYQTIGQIVSLFSSPQTQNKDALPVNLGTTDQKNSASPQIKEKVLSVITAITGYESSMLHEDMELEADLGIDTVKQATILSELSGELSTPSDSENLIMSDYDTIGKIVTLFSQNTNSDKSDSQESPESGRFHQSSEEVSSLTKNRIISIISEISGYPENILEENMELEADLGIDTVKQATIFSLVGEKLAVSDFSDDLQLSSLTSIRELINFFKNFQKSTPQLNSAKPKIEKTEIRKNEISTTRENKGPNYTQGYLKAPYEYDTITKIIALNSDYHEEMIIDNLVLGDDYGFDSLQLITFRDAINKLSDKPIEWSIDPQWTIKDLKKQVKQIYPQGLKKEKKLPVVNSDEISRMILTLVPKKEKKKKIDFRNDTLLILGNNKNLASAFITNYKAKFKAISYIHIDSSNSEKNSISEIQDINPTLILDLSEKYFKSDTAQNEQAQVQLQANARYEIIRKLNQTDHRIKKILALVYSDGVFAITQESSFDKWNPMAGFYSGFYKALNKEWPNTDVTIIDATSFSKEQEQFLKTIYSELSQDDNGVEICWYKGKRMAVVAQYASFDDLQDKANLHLDYSDTIIVTGGASGITRKILLNLASHYKTNFAIIGRTALLDNAANMAALSDEELDQQKNSIREKLLKNNNRVTPMMIDGEFQKIKKSIQIFHLINEIKSRDCGIVYYQVDTGDPDKLEKTINIIRRDSGQITGIIHGAGIEISHLIEKKKLEEFEAVYKAKVLGAINFDFFCKQDNLKLIVTLSSISGRFGNRAQIDYSAANEYLAFWVRRLSKNNKTRALNIISSGWDNTGMAYENSFVRQYSAQMGISLMNSQKAANAALFEIIKQKSCCDVIFHKGLGEMWNKHSIDIDNFHLPLIDRFEKKQNGFINSYRNYSPQRDSFLDQHRISGTALMPGVFYMEMMAEYFHTVTPQKTGLIYKNLAFINSFKFYRDEYRQLTMTSQALSKSHFQFEFFAKSPGLLNDQITNYAHGELQSLSNIDIKPIEAGKPDDYSQKRLMDELIKSTAANERHVNFGPLFNEFKRVTNQKQNEYIYYNESGAIMEFPFPMAQIDNPNYPLHRFLINPSFLDSLHQAGAIYSILITDQQYLPVGAEEFGVIENQSKPGLYKVLLKLKKKEEDIIYYDIDMIAPDNSLCYYIRNSIFRRMNF